MKTRKNEIKSACDIYREMLSNPPHKTGCTEVPMFSPTLPMIKISCGDIDTKKIELARKACEAEEGQAYNQFRFKR